ncbi:MAG: acyl-CoA thioesterase [bacterium]|nr:acyl-CoA thioesterase [bacterium]
MSDCPRDAAIRVLMMPRDTNYHGTIFGGVILSHIDQAGAVAAIRAGCSQVTTVAMDKVEFHQPVKVGELVSFYTEVVKVGNTSITIKVSVEATQRDNGENVAVTSAMVTFVNIDNEGKKIPVPRN